MCAKPLREFRLNFFGVGGIMVGKLLGCHGIQFAILLRQVDWASIEKFNIALLAKWKWRLGVEDVGVWKEVLHSRYGSWRDMYDIRADNKNSRWWRDLGNICDVSNQNNWFDSRIKWVLGDGKQVRMWEDIWVCNQALKEKFPRTYSLFMCKDSMIVDVGDSVSIDNREFFKWNLLWRREMFEWEKELYKQLLDILNSVKWKRYTPDHWNWIADDSSKYTVRSGFEVLHALGHQSRDSTIIFDQL